MSDSAPTVIHGHCDPAFEAVREGLAKGFPDDEHGAACAVTIDGELVVDLWAGFRDGDRTLPWERDTIVNVWSTTKMLTSLCVLILHDRGGLSLDAPVADFWPEFAVAGKQDVLVRHVMGHTAGLPAFDVTPDARAVFDWDACCAALAAQAPRWAPGDGSGYHSETQGWLLGELVRRVSGKTLGTFFRDEVAVPGGLDVHIGLPAAEHGRCAEIDTREARSSEPPDPVLRRLEHEAGRRSLSLVNTAAWREAEMPASNAHADARGIALALAPLANGGRAGSRTLLSPATIARTFEVQADGIDRVTGSHFRLGIGYGLHCPKTPLGTNDRTLWWAGWGGSMCVVDVENRMTVAYVMNRMRGTGDVRSARVVFGAHDGVRRARESAPPTD